MSMTIDQLVDIVQADLTLSGLFDKVLPDIEIVRIIREEALDWFYKNYQFSKIKMFYYLEKSFIQTEEYNRNQTIVMPQEVEDIVRIVKIDNPTMFRLGIQAPNLSINMGVTNQPFLTSFVTTAGELGVYRSVISNFSDQINKMTANTLRFNFNHINKHLNFLTMINTDMMLEVYTRIEEEELFDNVYFKQYVIGFCNMRMGQALGRLNFSMPGNFQYNSADMISQGKEKMDAVIEKVRAETNTAWFIMDR
jgi:hypothetical protein